MSLKGKKVMVLGGAGFIGSHVTTALIDAGAMVTVVDNLFLGKKENVDERALFAERDMADEETVFSILERYKPELVYNLAVVPLPHSIINPRENINVNVAITVNLCEALRFKKFGRMVHFSSSEVYGSAEYAPMCEDHPWKASTPYAASKAACDMICLSYVRTFGCDISIARPFNNYGPRQNAGAYAGIIPLTVNRVLKGEELLIHGDGRQTRDYIYVEDTAAAAVMMGERSGLSGRVINIASGHEYQIDWLIREICKIACNGNQPPKISYAPERAGDVRRHIANTWLAKDLLGFEHSTNMTDGLKKTVDWYKKSFLEKGDKL